MGLTARGGHPEVLRMARKSHSFSGRSRHRSQSQDGVTGRSHHHRASFPLIQERRQAGHGGEHMSVMHLHYRPGRNNERIIPGVVVQHQQNNNSYSGDRERSLTGMVQNCLLLLVACSLSFGSLAILQSVHTQ